MGFFENKGHWKIVKMADRYIGDLLNLENYSAKSFSHGNPQKISTSKIERSSERLCLDFSIKILYLVLYIKSPVPPYIHILYNRKTIY